MNMFLKILGGAVAVTATALVANHANHKAKEKALADAARQAAIEKAQRSKAFQDTAGGILGLAALGLGQFIQYQNQPRQPDYVVEVRER